MDSRQGRMDNDRGVQDSRFRCEHSAFIIPNSAFEKPPYLSARLCIAALAHGRASDPSAITQAETRTVVRVSCKRRKEKGEGRK